MAVDTRDKRFSMIGHNQVYQQLQANPDGTIGAQDRAMLLYLYHGIALDTPAVVSQYWKKHQGRPGGYFAQPA